MKDNPITIGFDDARFDLKSSSKKITPLIGVVCQGTRMVKVIRKDIEIDGNDSTEALIELINQTQKHVRYVFTDTITFGGFNVADLDEVFKSTKKPIIAITEREVDLEAVRKALLKKFPEDYKEKIRKIVNAGNLFQTTIETAGGPTRVFFHCKGISVEEVEDLLKKVSIDSKLPECVRLAHIIGRIF